MTLKVKHHNTMHKIFQLIHQLTAHGATVSFTPYQPEINQPDDPELVTMLARMENHGVTMTVSIDVGFGKTDAAHTEQTVTNSLRDFERHIGASKRSLNEMSKKIRGDHGDN